jgi:hypothetical protein
MAVLQQAAYWRALADAAGSFLRRSAALAIAASACVGLQPPALAQERFSIFVGSDPVNVERMLELAQLRNDDVVIDLGSGDGRIVIGAALANPNVRGIGVDIDAKLVAEATHAAQQKGVHERVRFVRENAFDADLSQVSVIFMWLWPELQTMLRPKILAEARPGTRVVTNVWDLGSWLPDAEDPQAPIKLWIVPAKVDGYWSWELPLRGMQYSYATILEQRFQRVEGFTRVHKRRAILDEVRLRGEHVVIRCGLTLEGVGYARHEFSGKVNGNVIEGSVRITMPGSEDRSREETIVLPWKATRVPSSGYFAPTGLEAP